MKKKQPFILHLSSIKHWGGGEQQLIYLYEGLVQRQVPQLIVCRASSALAHHCEANAFTYITCPTMNNIDFKTAWQLAGLCQQYSVDIIHAHDARAHTTVLLAMLLFRIRPTLIVSRKVTFPIKPSWLSRYKYRTTQVARIICISEAVQSAMRHALPDLKTLVVVPDGIDLERFQPRPRRSLRQALQLDATVQLVGIAASLTETKDLHTFIDVAKHISHPNIKWLIMGEGSLRETLENYTALQGLTTDIIFMGFRPDLADLLPQLDCFMLTSRTEGLGSVILEAMACQIPIIATRVGGIPEVVLDGETGLLAEAQDAPHLAKQVLSVLNSPTLRTQLVTAAYARLSDYSLASMVEKTMAVYVGAWKI